MKKSNKRGPKHRHARDEVKHKLIHRTVSIDEQMWEFLSEHAAMHRQSASHLLREILGAWVTKQKRHTAFKLVKGQATDDGGSDETVSVEDLIG